MSGGALFVGLGSPHGDDQIGWRIAEELAPATSRARRVRKAASPADLLDWLEGAESLWIADACRGAGVPGAVFRWRWPDVPAGVFRGASSHSLGLVEVLTTAQRLGRLPGRVELVGIEAAGCDPGAEISPAVAAALPRVVAFLRDEWNHA